MIPDRAPAPRAARAAGRTGARSVVRGVVPGGARRVARTVVLGAALALALPVPGSSTGLARAQGVADAPARAADAAALSRIGFVDIPYLIDRAPQALEAERRLEAEFRPRQAELERQRSELATLAARLADSSRGIDDAERTRLDREARGLERRIERDEQDFREELSIQKNNEFKTVRILVLEAIARFGKRLDYDLIVSDGVLYADERIDVTERILESLSREHARLQSSNQ